MAKAILYPFTNAILFWIALKLDGLSTALMLLVFLVIMDLLFIWKDTYDNHDQHR